jgi:hypothetical protein
MKLPWPDRMETQFYELGGTGLMRARRKPGFLEPAYFDGATGEYVVDGALLRYLKLQDRDETREISEDEARALEASS